MFLCMCVLVCVVRGVVLCGCVFVVAFVWWCFCGGIFFRQGWTFVALRRSYAKSVDSTHVKRCLV